MENSKLIHLLQTFSTKEWRLFGEFLESPYFNKNEELVAFYKYLHKLAPSLPPHKIERKYVFKKLYPNRAFENKTINYLMSFTLKLAEQFLAQQALEKDGIAVENYSLQELLERKLDKHYRFIFQQTDKNLQKQKWRNTDYYYYRYLMAHTDNQYFLRQKIRKYDDRLQKAADHLDQFYVCVKLRQYCEMLDRKQSLKAPYEIHFLEEIKMIATRPAMQDLPPVKIYHQILLMLEDDQKDQLFHEFMKLLPIYRDYFPKEEIKEIYGYAINYTIRKINKGQPEYLDELFNLYKYAIENALLLEKEHLSPWAFKNMIGVALRLQKYDWTESFIKEYHAHLHPQFQQNALHYNLAELYYYQNQADKALQELNSVEFSDVYYQMDTKKLMLKIYYEQREIDPFYSLSAAFKMLLRRNKLLSANNKTAYENFVSLLNQMIKEDPKTYDRIRKKIDQTQLLADRKWLKNQLEKLSA